MSDFRELVDLASERLGGAAVAANDEFFAAKENLLKAGRPVFREGEYTDRGKWMDGWETRRRRDPGIRLVPDPPGTGRRAARRSRGHRALRRKLSAGVLARGGGGRGPSGGRAPPRRADPLGGASPAIAALRERGKPFPLQHERRFTHARLNIFPDGGVARLRLFGTVAPDWDRLTRTGGEVDLASLENGGLVVSASDMFFGSRHNLILPGRGRDMSDGWETRRRRGPGHDWAIVKLGRPGPSGARRGGHLPLQGERARRLLGRSGESRGRLGRRARRLESDLAGAPPACSSCRTRCTALKKSSPRRARRLTSA